MLIWLNDNDCTFILSYNGNGYKVEIVDREKRVFKAKGGTADYALFNGIKEILKQYGGNPVNKYYEIIEADFQSPEKD